MNINHLTTAIVVFRYIKKGTIHKRRHRSVGAEGYFPNDYFTYSKAYSVKVTTKGEGVRNIKILMTFFMNGPKWTFKVMCEVRKKQNVHFECRMVLFYMIWGVKSTFFHRVKKTLG